MNFVDHPNVAFALMDQEHFESLDKYVPNDGFIGEVRKLLPAQWRIQPNGFWTYCSPPDARIIEHGWKIHVSATPRHAVETLTLAAEQAFASSTSFKFCSDNRMLQLSFNKNASRAQAGKFIALYPHSQAEFEDLIARLHAVTTHLVGPYVLTDRPYRDSQAVFYRYGEHRGNFKLNRFGQRLPGFHIADGSWYADSREPRFRLPPGVTDPFTAEAPVEQPDERGVLLNQRYRVQKALKFNAGGGVYQALDEHTGAKVVIREERGSLGLLRRADAKYGEAYTLHKEARILKRLTPTGCVPEYVDMFQEWRHWFLVQEHVEAQSLWGHAMGYYFAHAGQTSAEAFVALRSIIGKIAASLEKVHAAGVVLRDLTRTNVLVSDDGEIKFIDFEFSHELDDQGPWALGSTPGYAGPQQLSNQTPTVQDDHYAFGVLILDLITFSASGLDLNRQGLMRKLRQNIEDIRLPAVLYDIVAGLTEDDVARRWDLHQVVAALDRVDRLDHGPMFQEELECADLAPPAEPLIAQLRRLVADIGEHIDASADLSRQDRLWPASANVFATNPVSLRHGAAGPAYFLLHTRGAVEPAVLDWIERQSRLSHCPTGLFSGLGGVATLLLACGRGERAAALMQRAHVEEKVFDGHGLYFGAAGWGLASLHLWLATGDSVHLTRAAQVGDWLLRSAHEDEHGLHWWVDGMIPLGLGEGQSGVAVFLIYLASASGEPRYLRAAERALDFDIAHAIDYAGRLLWQPSVDAKPSAPRSPHTWFGSSGVGAACLRGYVATGEQRFKDIALRCALSASSRFTNKIWQFEGLAGFGEFMLDLHQMLGDDRYRKLAYHQAEGLLPHAIERPRGVAFAGLNHFRISNEYSEGSSGIGLFVDRLLHGKPRLLMLDQLLLPSGAPPADREPRLDQSRQVPA